MNRRARVAALPGVALLGAANPAYSADVSFIFCGSGSTAGRRRAPAPPPRLPGHPALELERSDARLGARQHVIMIAPFCEPLGVCGRCGAPAQGGRKGRHR